MAITYTWIVERMDCYPEAEGQTDVVFNVNWRLNGVDGAYAATVYGTCTVPTPGDPFTPYADLTQDQVLGWIWANGVDKNEYETGIAGQIAYQMNPPVVTPPLPWAEGN